MALMTSISASSKEILLVLIHVLLFLKRTIPGRDGLLRFQKFGQLLGCQMEAAGNRHIVGVLQLRFLFFQVAELGLHLRNLVFRLVNLFLQFFNLRVQFITSNLSGQTPKCIKVLLPVACVDVCVGDRVPAMDHHPVTHIDSHMACAAGIVSPLKENQVAGPCIGA